MKSCAKERIDELTDILNKAAYEYYTLDSPSITDQEYDKYLKELETLEEKYPEYKFEKHKGYGTKLHYQMLDEYGPSEIHRQTFLKTWYAKK